MPVVASAESGAVSACGELVESGAGPLLLAQEPVQEHSGSVQTEEFRQVLRWSDSATLVRVAVRLVQVLVVSLSNYLLGA